jgi:hypothetical protein
LGSTRTGADHAEPFHVSTFPLTSAARQKVVLGHDTEAKPSPPGSIERGADHAEPFHVSTFPLLSSVTQELADAHDSAARPVPFGSFTVIGADHVEPFQVKTVLLKFMAMQNIADGQERELISVSGSIGWGEDQPVAPGADKVVSPEFCDGRCSPAQNDGWGDAAQRVSTRRCGGTGK